MKFVWRCCLFVNGKGTHKMKKSVVFASFLAFAMPSLSHAETPNAKIPFNQCEGISEYSYYQSFPNQKTLIKFYPHVFTSKNSKLPFVDTKNFNFICGGTALAGQITIKKNGDTLVRECGDMTWQSEKDACKILYHGKYQDKLKLKSGDYYKISQGKLFLFNKDGTIDVTNID